MLCTFHVNQGDLKNSQTMTPILCKEAFANKEFTTTTAFHDREFSMPEIRKTTKRKLGEEFESEIDTLDSASVLDDDDSRSHASKEIGKRKSEASEGERLLKDLTSSVSSLAENASHMTHFLWAKLLAEKLKQMEQKKAERFKIYVNTIALDAIDGDWP